MMDFNDPCLVDEATVRQFIQIISEHATHTINGSNGGSPGVLQLFRISPADEEAVVPSRFQLNDVDHMVQTAVNDAAAGHNVYIEARTVRKDLRGKKRGKLEDTVWVLGLVVDSDADKNKAGSVTAKPSLAVETSPGNYHLWYLFDRAISASEAHAIGEAMRKSAGADQDTGVITQCYRVAGTPNFPSASKRERGRITVEPTRIFEYTARLWDPEELLKAFPPPKSARAKASQNGGAAVGGQDDEATLPDELLEVIRHGAGTDDRSAAFHSMIAQLKKRRWSIDAITALLEKYPDGIAQKYLGRVYEEVERSYDKFADATAPAVGGVNAGAGTTSASGAGPAAAPHVLQTIHIVAGQLPRILSETEQALLAAGMPIFARAGTLVYPVIDPAPAADGRKTLIARLRRLCANSLIEWVSDAALFRRFNAKRHCWVDIDPPHQVLNSLLVREGRWSIPRISGVITTPTLRADGSLLADAGYDPRTELYLLSGFGPLAIPEEPMREQAQAALVLLNDLLDEFLFVGEASRVVALAAILTALVRGSLATAPMYLIQAHASGTGKSYLVDLISAIATGRECPVHTVGENKEEIEKRLGSLLLDGSPIMSLDNCMKDLGGPMLCQISERPLIKARILGRSEMPECECRTTVLATGNNVGFKADMLRRGLTCYLDAQTGRPELREFKRDPLSEVLANRKGHVTAALTIIRAYLTAGSPKVCGSLGSYNSWSRMVRSPLIWLGLPDPVASIELSREEDPELADIRELFSLWIQYLSLDDDYTVEQIINAACTPPVPGDFNPQPFKELLLRASGDNNVVSSRRIGWWLRGASGRVIDKISDQVTGSYRLDLGRRNKARACYRLSKVGD